MQLFLNIVLSVNDFTVLCVLLSWEFEGFKEFCAGERFDQCFFQHFVVFKNLELIMLKKVPAMVYCSFCGSLLTFHVLLL